VEFGRGGAGGIFDGGGGGGGGGGGDGDCSIKSAGGGGKLSISEIVASVAIPVVYKGNIFKSKFLTIREKPIPAVVVVVAAEEEEVVVED